MTGLLDLPSELLFEIISLVASSPYPADAIQKRYRPARLQSRAVICFPSTDPSWPTHTNNLLLTCKRLHHETSIFLSKSHETFQLDIAIVNNHWIWPTWRHLACPVNYVLESLEINLIHCCSEDERASFDTDSANWPTSQELLKVIAHFLRCGTASATFESTSVPKRRSNFRVKTITINVDTARIRTGTDTLSYDDVPLRQVQGLAHLDFTTLYSIDIATCLDNLNRLSTFFRIAMRRTDDVLTIRERVDKIVFSADGRTMSEIYIAKHISDQEASRIAEYRRREST
ncbi:hypothetical protein DE146DRAFT_757697 [Phaeosphaeria sp. MPI-PUGE-AT-0046c]|nr:hypothetical protein DE146DRAFT_757697 [Phaeosphaeria sp. MPI-PUGE-AT-0046c]